MSKLKPKPMQLFKFSRLSPDKNITKLFLVTVATFVLMAALRPNLFLTLDNFRSMAFQFPELGFISIGLTFVIISGGIDLSAVSTANLSAVVSAFILADAAAKKQAGMQLYLTIFIVILISIVIGILCGALNGFLISRFNIPPILATLGTMNLYTGIAIVLTKGAAINKFPEEFLVIGNGYLLGLPIPLIMFIIAAVTAAIILNKTKYGFELRFYGSNSVASWFSGVKNNSVVMKTYIFCGLLASIVGIEFLARSNSAKADYGSTYALHGILCALLGGVNPSGGYGKISGMVLALISLQFLTSGFNMLRLGGFFKEFVWGVLLLLVMTINYVANQRELKAKNTKSIKQIEQKNAVSN